MKKCNVCGIEKEEISFPIAKVTKNKTYRRLKCGTCKIATQSKRKAKILLEIRAFKESKGCEICKFKDGRALQFHHKNPSSKEIDISNAICLGWSLNSLFKEIEKCSVLCANCPAILHSKGEN